jgi:ATP-binding cassette subfamily F protein uup
MPTPRNLLNLKSVEKGYGSRSVLNDVTLGVAAGERIGVVGQNGGGKSTLLHLIAGVEQPDGGALTRAGDVGVALLDQRDELNDRQTIRAALIGDRADHEWAADRTFRSVLDGLLGGVSLDRFPAGFDTPIDGLSGGERRRIALARLLLDAPELLLLDEPTNHLDVEGVDWLAHHLAARRGSMLVVTHDRWFLDAVCTATWEVSEGAVHQYEGGYAAYVLARAERYRQQAAREDRRRQLVRKELAWLRRGPPARTTKPKFRIEAANALIADEPQVRDRAELLRFAGARLGDKVLDAVEVSLTLGTREVLHGVTWRLGPGDRVALVGVNGSGKTSLLRLLAAELEPTAGLLERGATVRLAHLSQDTVEIPGHLRVLESLEEVRSHAVLSDGREITATLLCDRFGFRGEKARTLVSDLSGGERRRLGLMRLLMGGPNVLLLDEPTNDLDVDTLTALEDLLDGWPGTLVVVSHDRYFVERVCDNVHALTPAGGIRHLPGGIDQYLRERHDAKSPRAGSGSLVEGDSGVEVSSRGGRGGLGGTSGQTPGEGLSPGAAVRAARKQTQRSAREVKRLEREIEEHTEREAALQRQMAANATDYGRLAELQGELESLVAEREELETSWLETSESLDSAQRGQ